MNRQAFIERLRAWAARADTEVIYAHTEENKRTWQGNAGVLHAVANVAAAGASDRTDPRTLRLQLIADRQKVLASWNEQRAELDVATLTGEAQAYELILDLLKDADESWAA